MQCDVVVGGLYLERDKTARRLDSVPDWDTPQAQSRPIGRGCFPVGLGVAL